MLKIKMYSMYDHFPALNPQGNEPHINCYSDTHVTECTGAGKNIALMLEPRSMINSSYDYVYEHQKYFKHIFTHDSRLLTLPQAHLFTWGDVWLQTDSNKTKGISICTSYKNWCPLHNARLELARMYQGSLKVDTFFGDWNNPQIPNIKPQDYLEHYKYSIIIENDVDEYWYTEKILNCFATKTVPIYVGATKIHELFNDDGIIQVNNWRDIPQIVDTLQIDADYNARHEAIEDNYKRVEPYKVKWKDRFIRDYGQILEGLQNE